MLYDGTRMNVGSTSEAELDAIIRAGGRQGQIYAGLKTIRDRFAPLIREKFPRIPRRVSGYNLDELLPENGFNVARAARRQRRHVRHSSRATLRLTASPPFRRLVCIGFPDPFIAADHVPAILTYKPIGLEGFDNAIPDSLRAKGMRLDEVKVLPEGKGVLLVEFGAWTSEDVDAQAEQFGAWLATLNPRPMHYGLRRAKQRRCGTSASRHWARSPYSLEEARVGRMGRLCGAPRSPRVVSPGHLRPDE